MFAAITIVVLAIGLAVVVDLSRLYVQRTELQTGADAGAIAGALQLRLDSASVVDSAVAFAGKNTVLNNTVTLSRSNVTCGVWNDSSRIFTTDAVSGLCGSAANAVQVSRTDSSHYLFPQFLSASRLQVVTKATAWVAPTVTRTNCVKPFAVIDTILFHDLNVLRKTPRSGNTLDSIDFQILRTQASSLTFCIKNGPPNGNPCSGSTPPGNFNVITIPPGGNGSGAAQYVDNIENCKADLGVGDALPVETGNMAKPTADGMTNWCQTNYASEPCLIKLVLWHVADPGATAWDGSTCQNKTTGSGWCVKVSMIAGAVVTTIGSNGSTQGVLQGHFALLNDPGGFIGTTPGLLQRVILVQ